MQLLPAAELYQFVGRTLELASTARALRHIVRHMKGLSSGPMHVDYRDSGADVFPRSTLFTSAHFTLQRDWPNRATAIAAAEFVVRPGAITLGDLERVFGRWRRSPPAPVPSEYAIACFDGVRLRTRAPFSLFASFPVLGDQLHAHLSPERIVFQLRE